MYKFLAVFESWISIRGMCGGRSSRARIVAMISAVLILVVAVPKVGGRYVVLEIKGFICCVCQDGFCMMGVGASWRTPSVALAVMMG